MSNSAFCRYFHSPRNVPPPNKSASGVREKQKLMTTASLSCTSLASGNPTLPMDASFYVSWPRIHQANLPATHGAHTPFHPYGFACLNSLKKLLLVAVATWSSE